LEGTDMRRQLTPVVAAAVLTLTFSTVSPAAGSPATDPIDAAAATSIREWNELAVTAIISTTPPTPGPVGPLYLTYVHRAVHDAVKNVPDGASVRAAIARAAFRVLTVYFPAREADFTIKYDSELLAVPDGDAEVEGIEAGENAAKVLLLARQNDGLNGTPLALKDAGPGVWRPVPEGSAPAAAASWLGSVKPFVLESPSQFRPDGPPSLTKSRWARDYEEVRLYGGADNTAATTIARTPEQTRVALFWSDPPAVQSQRALRGYSVQEELDALETARLFALVNTASADALIACADAKFTFNFWRPVGAIPAGDTDSNPRTVDDNDWTSLVMTPNFPEYPSNHSCATTAIATVVDRLDGSGGFDFTMTSLNARPDGVGDPVTEQFSSRGDMIRHVGNGRVWGGLHYRFSVEDGTDIGRAVAKLVLRDDRRQ
jgi:hypothetical protein